MIGKCLKKESMPIEGGSLPVELWEYEMEGTYPGIHGYYILVDGVEWCDCAAAHHALILFDFIKEHANEKMTYVPIHK